MDPSDVNMPEVPTITPRAAYDEIRESHPLVIDVRTPEDYAKAHVPTAINIPADQIAVRAEQELPDKDARILVYCHLGIMAAFAVDALLKMGYTNVVSFGGINGWIYETVS